MFTPKLICRFIARLFKLTFYLACSATVLSMVPWVAQAYAAQMGEAMPPAAMENEAPAEPPDPRFVRPSFSPTPTNGTINQNPPRMDVFVTSILRNATAKRSMLLWFSYPASVRGRVFGGGSIESPRETGGW